MSLKKALAHRIVEDFHGKDAAGKAAEDWARQFQKKEAPEEIEHLSVAYVDIAAKCPDGQNAIKLDKLLVKCGLADSGSDGMRKVRANSVRIDGEVKSDPVLPISLPAELTVRVGRGMKKVSIT